MILWFYDKAELLAFPGDLAGLLNTFFVPVKRCAVLSASWRFIRGLHVAAPLPHTRRCAGQSFCSHPAKGQENVAVESRLLLLPQCDTESSASHLGRRCMQVGAPAAPILMACLVICTA